MTKFKKEIKDLLKDNKKCFDCGMPNPQWASVTFGIFMCLECAGNHRSYGVSINRVKSVNMDDWNEREYLMVKNGGNSKFADYVQKHNLDPKTTGFYKLPVVTKYGQELAHRVGIPAQQPFKADPEVVNRSVQYEGNVPRHMRTSEKSQLQRTLNSTISLVSSTVKSGAKIIKKQSISIGGKINESILKPSLKMIRGTRDKRADKSISSNICTGRMPNKDADKKPDETTWNRWD